MAIERTDIFHCLKCGRMVYQPHGLPAPSCCNETMFAAVTDGIHQVPESRSAQEPSPVVDAKGRSKPQQLPTPSEVDSAAGI
jgi:hypothetical protein